MNQKNTPAGFTQHYGPWALVAGASQGLGAAFATQLAEKGLNLVLIARHPDALNGLASRLTGEYGIQVISLPLDLSQADGIDTIVSQTQDLEIGLLIYNAAYAAIGPFFDIPLENHFQEADTNVRAPLALAYHFGRRMLPRGHGGIILMSSLSSAQGSALIANYAATKAYNLILAEGMWDELRTRGISVLACSAGSIQTHKDTDRLDRNSDNALISGMPPEAVARETLAALGKQPYIIPGRNNRLAAFAMRHLMPRTLTIRLMGRVLRGMYQ